MWVSGLGPNALFWARALDMGVLRRALRRAPCAQPLEAGVSEKPFEFPVQGYQTRMSARELRCLDWGLDSGEILRFSRFSREFHV